MINNSLFNLNSIAYKGIIFLLKIAIVLLLFFNISCTKDEGGRSNFDLSNLFIERIDLDTHIHHIDFVDKYYGVGINTDNIYLTEDGGYSWDVVYEGENLIYINIFDKNNIIATGREKAGLKELYFNLVSNDAGKTFEKFYLNEITSSSYQISTFNDGTGFIATHDGILKSSNHGKSWERVLNTNKPVTKVVKSVEGKLYCGSDEGVVYKSSDNGSNWTQIQTTFNHYIYIKEIENNRIYFLHSGDGLYSTVDFVEFKDHNRYFSNTSNYLHVLTNGDMVYFGHEYRGGIAPTGVVYLSDNYGKTWEANYIGGMGFVDGIKISDEEMIILGKGGYNQILHIIFLNN